MGAMRSGLRSCFLLLLVVANGRAWLLPRALTPINLKSNLQIRQNHISANAPQKTSHTSPWKQATSFITTRFTAPPRRIPLRRLALTLAVLGVCVLLPAHSAHASSTVTLLSPEALDFAAFYPPTPVPLAPSLASPLTVMQQLTLTRRLVVAALLGGIVGKERSASHHHAAGVRTMALVSLGAAAFTACSIFGFAASGLKYDPSRMASSVATGVGFVGAGVITTHTKQPIFLEKSSSKDGSIVRGLTTAAAIWLSAAIGTLCGVGLCVMGSVTGILTLCVLRFGSLLQKLGNQRDVRDGVMPARHYEEDDMHDGEDDVMQERDDLSLEFEPVGRDRSRNETDISLP